MATKDQTMPKAHIRDGELRIPLTEDIREKLDVHEGEELEAHVFEDSLTVTRTTPEARRRAGERILKLVDQVRLRPGQPPMSSEEIDQMVDEEVKAFRRERRAQQHD